LRDAPESSKARGAITASRSARKDEYAARATKTTAKIRFGQPPPGENSAKVTISMTSDAGITTAFACT